MPIRVVTDSACDLPQTLADEHGIAIVPLTIRFGSEEFVDRAQLSVAEFWRRCAASPVLPETAAPAPGVFEEAFRKLAAEGATGIVCVNLSGELSATIQSARLAAEAVTDLVPVRVVDSHQVTLALGLLAIAAAQYAQTDASLDAVVAAVEALASRTRVFGALDTLDNLKKGGRIGGAAALVGSLLNIKPIIEVRNGRVEQEGKQRTRAKALAYLVDKVRSLGPVDRIAVAHAQCSDIDSIVNQLQPLVAEPIVVGEIGPVIGTHAGPGTVGIIVQVAPGS